MAHIIITGTNRGIGKETARQLAEQGHQVWALARNPAEIDLDEKNLTRHTCDVTNTDSIDNLVNELKAAGAQFDVLINNAGRYSGTAAQVMQVNYWGVKKLTHTLLPMLKPKARILNISSGMGDLSGFSQAAASTLLDPGLDEEQLDQLVSNYESGKSSGWPSNAYSASKAALNSLTRIWHRQWPQVVTISICPGWVRTDMGGAGAPRSVSKGAETPVWAATTGHLRGGCFYRDKKQISW